MNFFDLRDEVIDDLDEGISIEILSAPGRGKSTFVADLVAYLSERDKEPWGFSTLFLATQTPPDLIGYQFKGEREWEGRKVAVTEPTLPLWMVTREGKPVWAYRRGILFLDEYGQGEADVKRASAELLLNHQIGPWRLPDGWGVIAASNRASDRSGVTKSFDFVINRRGQYDITDDLDAWEAWAIKNGVMPMTIAFAHQNGNIVFSDGVPAKQGPWTTPRTLVMSDAKLQRKMKRLGKLPDDAKTQEAISGLMGAGAIQYFNFVKLELEMPKYDVIIANPEKVRVPDKPDAQMLVCYNLAMRVSEKDAKAVITYVNRMPKEFAVTFATAACRRTASLIACDAFKEWSRENASLMAAVANTR